MHLLDTDTLTHLHAGHPRVLDHLRALDDPEVGTTIITKIEILRGRFDFVLKAATGKIC
jgi:tRNA(fMet)-specific endonuclease VapC